MDVALKILKVLAAMTNHRPREGSHCFGGNFDRPRSEKFVVRLHVRMLAAKCSDASDRSTILFR